MPPRKLPSSVTIRDVAQRAGVSVATVSRVLNLTAPVSPDTDARVQAAIRELQYVPQAAAQNLSNRKTNSIGLLLPEITWDNFFPPMLRGIENACFEAGFDLLIHSSHHARPQPRAHLHIPVGEHNTDGLIIFTNAITDDDISRLYQKGFPLVLLHRSPPGQLEIPHVVFENKAGARKVTDHLIETHGYRRIAFLAGPQDSEDADWRELGYRESLIAHGLPVDPGLIRLGSFDEEIARQTMERWLDDGFAAQAVFAADDDSAIGALRALQGADIRIPQDVALVGFDDPPTSRLLNPPLTTVRAPIEGAGYLAVRTLVQIIHSTQADYKTLLPTELVIRCSCGCLT